MSINIDNELWEEIDHTSKTQNDYNKSELTEKALKLWLKNKQEELMVKGYKEMAQDEMTWILLNYRLAPRKKL